MRATQGLALLVGLASATCREPFTSGGSPRVIWRADGAGHGRPVFDDALVYFLGQSHDVFAIEKQGGKLRWRGSTGVQGGTTDGYDIVLAGNIVAVADLDVYGFDRAKGLQLWRFRPSEYYAGYLGIATDGQTIFAGSAVNRAYGVDAATGTQRWTTLITADSNAWIAHPVAGAGNVYYCITYTTNPDSGAVAALDAASGQVKWLRNFPAPSAPRNTGCYVRVALSRALVIASGSDGRLYALDQKTGDIVWLSSEPTNEANFGPIATQDTLLIMGTTSGEISAFDARSGASLWQSTAEQGGVILPVAVDEKQIFAVHFGGQLASLDIKTGQVLWVDGTRVAGDGEWSYTPAVDKDRIYIGGYHGLYALKR